MGRTVLLVAGEASGDVHAARLAQRLRTADPTLSLIGIGGGEMERAGVRILLPMRRLSVVGLTEVVTRLPKLAASYRAVRRIFRTQRPDLFIAVDFPGFNLRLACLARAHGVPVLYYIGPQIWAWWRGRIATIRRCVDRMAVIFPFEESLYRTGGVDAQFVGHPIVEVLEELEPHRLEPPFDDVDGRPLVGLFPGSRKAEVARILPPMLDTAVALHRLRPDVVFAIGVADTILPGLIASHLARMRDRHGKAAPTIRPVQGATYALMRAARAALVASGTATLEAAYLGCPMAILYRVSPLTWAVARRIVKLPYIGLPNFALGRPAIPEFLQDIDPEVVARAVERLLDTGQERAAMLEDLRQVRHSLGRGGASMRAAEMALALLSGTRRAAPAEAV
jgi:lipid-A-disaccharide synthase